jgi:sugar phosphate isomerase/epimerase
MAMAAAGEHGKCHPMPDRLDVSLSHYLCPANLGVIPFLDLAAAGGFSSMGLTARALDEVPLRLLKQELAVRDLGITALNSAGFFFDQVNANHRLLEAASELGGVPVNVIPGTSTAIPLHEVRRRTAEHLASFSHSARRLGVPLLLEPMHPALALTRSSCNTIAHAREMTAGLVNVRLNVDLFHLWWDPDLLGLLADAGSLGLMQVCDVAVVANSTLMRRVPLGEGMIDWQSALAASLAPIELELFADQLPGRSVEALIAASGEILRPLTSCRATKRRGTG